MTKRHVEVITSIERRRRWSDEEKERLVLACLEPDASVSQIARSVGEPIVSLAQRTLPDIRGRGPIVHFGGSRCCVASTCYAKSWFGKLEQLG